MSHRIEYLTIDGGTIIEFTDDKGLQKLQAEEKLGFISILNKSRYDISKHN
jgi:hypothetical protein